MPATLGILAGLCLLSPTGLQAQRHNQYQTDVRGPVDATIGHLQRIAAANTYSGKERSRYDAALTHLSQFVDKIQHGQFDRGKLDRSIDDVQNVLSKNPLDGRARDILNNDVMQLRRLRASYPH